MSTPQGADVQALVAERGGVPVTVVAIAGATGQLMTGIGLVTAISAANTSITNATRMLLRDGIDTTGPVIAAIAAAAAQGYSLGPVEPGIYFGQGLYLQNFAGAATVTVTYIPLTLPLK